MINNTPMRRSTALFARFFVVAAILLMGTLVVSAGSTLDRGTLPGTPASGTVNYIAWYSTASPPNQILTEDGYNSATGQDQGYQDVSGTPNWLLNISNFNPEPSHGTTVNILLGGTGVQAGNIWTYSFTLDTKNTLTNHGEVGINSAVSCPTMTAGLQDETGKSINWTSTGTSNYAIYRSQNASGAGNGASNGRYELVTTVSGVTTTYKDITCSTGTDCWHVIVPLNASSQIAGCHSQETNPTVVTVASLTAASSPAAPYARYALFASVIGLAAAALVWIRRR